MQDQLNADFGNPVASLYPRPFFVSERTKSLARQGVLAPRRSLRATFTYTCVSAAKKLPRSKSTRPVVLGRAAVYRFGSRVDDGKCGGDIDLYIETDEADVRVLDAKYDFLARLKQRIGDQRNDVLVSFPSRKHKAIIEIAKALSALGVGSAPSRGPRDLSPPW